MADEFDDREFSCAGIIPRGLGYEQLPPESQICVVLGGRSGSSLVNGDDYINLSFDYWNSYQWRIGMLCAFWGIFAGTYLIAA
ncbi:CDR ABC transporter [Clohesyomyces aquaticus]|uniref:CDR ABC transporter n=1 Tax=Clohesyomyces aquaticus TaxID=1231657 RepID=A0A1Y2A8E0_9PLEO|nr:CDR ABC transporter [Clohesyomyces aquaticus]